MANKVFNMAGGRHSAAAYSAFEDALYGSCVATDTDFVCTAGTGMTVQLTAGDGLISTGSRYARRIQADATNTITITAASATLPRIDAIVAYIDNAVTPSTSYTDNTNGILKFVAVAGTPASTPSAPNATTIQSSVGAGNPYMVLWEITVPAGATALNTATFTDRRETAKIEIADGSITTNKLASGAVTTAKIDANAITQAKVDMADLTTMTAIQFTDYFTPATGWTFTGQLYKLGHFVFGTLESAHTVSIHQNNIGTCSSNIVQGTYGAGRVGDSQAQNSYAGTVLFIPNGQVRFHAAHAGTSLAFTILLYVSN